MKLLFFHQRQFMIVTILTGFVVILSSNFADPAKVYDFDGYCYKDMRKSKIRKNLLFDPSSWQPIRISVKNLRIWYNEVGYYGTEDYGTLVP